MHQKYSLRNNPVNEKANYLSMKKSIMIVATALIMVACNKESVTPSGEIQFTKLSADKVMISSLETSTITASVSNACSELTYEWSASSGSINGSNASVVFTPPANSDKVTVTCTLNHPGKQTVAKSIEIAVQ